jgi:formate hydrogenlyase transcriptional activator
LLLPVSLAASASVTETAVPQVLTADEIARLEYENILRALEASGWRVAGASGAAALLKLKPSTLASRMKALGIHKPESI